METDHDSKVEEKQKLIYFNTFETAIYFSLFSPTLTLS